MKRSHRLTCLALLALLPALAKAADPLDPRALAALSNMGSYLHRLQAFSLSTRSETDQQLDSGPTVTFAHHTQVLARQPDKLFVSVDQGSAARQFFYDGKQFTLYDGRHGYYSKGTAPATIEQLLDQAGTDKTRLLSVTIYMKDIDADFAGMNAVWDQWLPAGVAPARATVEAKLCEAEILVELSVVAALP